MKKRKIVEDKLGLPDDPTSISEDHQEEFIQDVHPLTKKEAIEIEKKTKTTLANVRKQPMDDQTVMEDFVQTRETLRGLINLISRSLMESEENREGFITEDQMMALAKMTDSLTNTSKILMHLNKQVLDIYKSAHELEQARKDGKTEGNVTNVFMKGTLKDVMLKIKTNKKGNTEVEVSNE